MTQAPPIDISHRHSTSLAPQQAIAAFLDGRRLSRIALWAGFALIVALSFAAPMRRTGDAHQYHAMAWSLASGRGPALAPDQQAEWNAWLAAQPAGSGFPEAIPAMRQPALVRDGAQEFSHFWVYPLLAAPFVKAATIVGLHPGFAFLALNAALMAVALTFLDRHGHPLAGALLLATPVVWFVGKAQVEAFTWALLSITMVEAVRGRFLWGAFWVAVASTQNLPIAALVLLFWAAEAFRRVSVGAFGGDNRVGWQERLLVGATVAVALLHPAYYWLRLGVVTPQELNNGIAARPPDLTRYFTPLVDPDLGLAPWAPFLLLATAAGVVTLRSLPEAERRPLALATVVAAVSGVWLLYVFAQTTNVNSGGSVWITRYALWLMPLTIPALIALARGPFARGPWVAALGLAGIAAYAVLFSPRLPERYVVPSPQAAFANAWLPGLYLQVPEVFYERNTASDGGVRGSAAAPGCRVILLTADAPDQPCPLDSSERSAAAALRADGWRSVWVVRPNPLGLGMATVVGAERAP